jgi:hypothetical protein
VAVGPRKPAISALSAGFWYYNPARMRSRQFRGTPKSQTSRLKILLSPGVRRRTRPRAPHYTWPEEALKVLRAATTAYLASLAGPSEASARTDAQRDFSTVLDVLTRFAPGAGPTTLAGFPATTGLTSGEACRLAP